MTPPSAIRVRAVLGLLVLAGASLVCPAAAQPTAPDRQTRPIRGVWMRPPNAITGPNSFESLLPTLASAGIQDVFLETFYWGLATNNSNVYNDRFAFDYLAQAIVLAARHSIRVHAWCETGYQGFGTTGDYLLSSTGVGDQNGRTGNPDWRVLNVSDPGIFGDGTAGQMFVNMGHPGVRARLAEYAAEIASYPGLQGIQIDYCRYPLDNNTGDVYPAPWSYDAWTRADFQAQGFGDPLVTAARSSGPNSSQWNQFVTYRRAGISATVQAMYDALNPVNGGLDWSAAVFPSPYNSAQLTKMQDWPNWCGGNYLEIVVPMCYSSTQSSIRNELNSAISLAGGKRVVAGLAYPGATSHPDVATQLGALTSASTRIEDWVWFDHTYFTTIATASGNRTALVNWINASATRQSGDINQDGYIDARDRVIFNTVYTGNPVPVNAGNQRNDLNGDGVINATDQMMFNQVFARFHFGEDGVVDGRDLQALRNCFTPGSGPPTPGVPLNLWDLNGDGAVDYADQLLLHTYLTVPLPPDLDVNRDGPVDINDLYAQFGSVPIDVDRNGFILASDADALRSALRAGERADMAPGR